MFVLNMSATNDFCSLYEYRSCPWIYWNSFKNTLYLNSFPIFPTELIACESSPCLNGATCYERSSGFTFLCVCPPGFEGDLCEDRIDFCLTRPCQNGATCLEVTGGYECVCEPGYGGVDCEQGGLKPKPFNMHSYTFVHRNKYVVGHIMWCFMSWEK